MKTLRLIAVIAALLVSTTACSGLGTLPSVSDTVAAGDPAATASPTPTMVPSPQSTVEPDSSAPKASVSVKCDSADMTAAFDKAGVTLENAATSNHTPFPGSPQEIADANGGMMCRWDIGDGYLSVWWTTVDSEAWNAAEEAITARGGAMTDIPGLSADVSYFQSDPGNPSSFARWNVDALTGSTWIHIGHSTWTKPEDGAKVYDAARAVAKLNG